MKLFRILNNHLYLDIFFIKIDLNFIYCILIMQIKNNIKYNITDLSNDKSNEEKYIKYKNKYVELKNLLNGGAVKINKNLTPEQKKILSALKYAKSLIGIPYRWYKKGEVISGDDKFWSTNLPPITAKQIKKEDKCIVCTGLINLIRRYAGLSVPGLDGKLGKISLKFPGTTWTWFRYLKKNKRLEEIDFNKKYPIGTLLISNYKSIEEQGHVAVIISNIGENVKEQEILHSYSNYCYKDCLNITNVGITGIQKINDEKILDWFQVTHICLPENWILKD